MKASGITRTAILSLLLGSVALACAAQDRPSDGKDKNHPGQDNARQQARPDQHAQQPRPSSRQEQPDRQQQRQPAQSQQRQPAQSQQRQPDQSQQRQPDRQQQRQPAQAQWQPAQQQQRQNESPQRAQQQPRQAPQQQLPTVSKQEEHNRQQRGSAPARQSQAQRGVQQAAWQQHRAGNWQSDHRTWQQRGGYSGYRIPDSRFRGYFGPDHGFRIQGLPFMVVGGYPRFQYDGYWLSVVDPWPANWGDDWYDNDQVYVVYADNGYYLYNRSYPGIGIAVSISM